MGINLIEYAEIWQTVLDQQMQQQATSNWMEANSGQVQYVGGKKVKIPTMVTSGMGDYNRGTGASNPGKYTAGSVNISYEDYEMKQDRSNSFSWDRHDIDESGFVLSAPSVMATFQTEEVIPEIDSFRYSSIASQVMAQGAAAYKSQALTTANILPEFTGQIRTMQNKTGSDTASLVATMPFSVYAILEQAAIEAKQIMPQTFNVGALSFEVKSINGVPIIPVVEDRMKTAYIFHDGTVKAGFEPAVGAKSLNWIITPRTVPIAISKTDILKPWSPDENINGDDWLLQYRKYHDLWIKKQQLNRIILSVGV